MPAPEKNLTAPPTFQDSEKRTWSINLTLELINSAIEHEQVSLTMDEESIGQVMGLLFDDQKLGSVLWLCIRRQAETKQIDRDGFFAALDGAALADGWEALRQAIVFFIRSRSPSRAAALNELIEKQMELIEAGQGVMLKTLQGSNVKEAMDKVTNTLGSDMEKEVKKLLDNFAMSSEVS